MPSMGLSKLQDLGIGGQIPFKQLIFNKCLCEHGTCAKSNKNYITLICLYVDDLLLFGNNDKKIKAFKNKLKLEFGMANLGQLSYFLGIEFKQTSK